MAEQVTTLTIHTGHAQFGNGLVHEQLERHVFHQRHGHCSRVGDLDIETVDLEMNTHKCGKGQAVIDQQDTI